MTIPRNDYEAGVSREAHATWVHYHVDPRQAETWGETEMGVSIYSP